MPNPVAWLRAVALFEAASFLVLLGVAMPLKHWWGMPLAVTVVGLIHGVLFLLVCHALWRVRAARRWPPARLAGVFVAALLPAVPFVIDGRLRRWADEWGRSPAP